jgi:hypothetical protein
MDGSTLTHRAPILANPMLPNAGLQQTAGLRCARRSAACPPHFSNDIPPLLKLGR